LFRRKEGSRAPIVAPIVGRGDCNYRSQYCLSYHSLVALVKWSLHPRMERSPALDYEGKREGGAYYIGLQEAYAANPGCEVRKGA